MTEILSPSDESPKRPKKNLPKSAPLEITFGKAVRVERHKTGKNLLEMGRALLGEETGSLQAISYASDLEKGRRAPSGTDLQRLPEFLGLSEEEFRSIADPFLKETAALSAGPDLVALALKNAPRL